MTRVAFALLVLCSLPSRAFAWLREPFEDADVVARSELIVVAHLEPGSVHHVDTAGGLSENHATLVITETLKGRASAAKIPVILHYGLTPLFTTGGVQILDSGSGGESLVADGTHDNVWLLRRRSGPYGREPGTGDLGIVDPQDLRPLADKAYLSLYLVREPEIAVRAYVAHHLSGDWWNAAAGSPLTLQRQERYGDVFESVIALHKIGDRRAKPAIELTLRRWKAIHFSNPQIVDECEAALRDVH